MALIALDVEVAHFMDRLKQAQNGLIFPLPSILRNDAREFPATNSPAAKRHDLWKGERPCVTTPKEEAWGIEGEGPSPYGPAILNSTRKEIAMSDKEKIALTKLTSKGG